MRTKGSVGTIRTGGHLIRQRCGSGLAICAVAGVVALSSGALAAGDTSKKESHKTAAAAKHVPLPRPRPHVVAGHQTTAGPVLASLGPTGSSAVRPDPTPVVTASAADLAAVREAIAFTRRGHAKDATEVQQRIADPLARKLVEWAILRSDENGADFARFQAFVAANPSWPNISMFRKRAEAMLWQERADLATIRGFTGDKPLSAKGRFALGRALLAHGDRAGAQALVREAWRSEPLPPDAEEQILDTFGDLITRADDKARMERRLYANDIGTALRAAHRLGGIEPAIAKARAAVGEKGSNAKALLEALPSSADQDTGVLFGRIQMLRRADKIAEAAELMLAAPRDAAQIYDPDEWWVERRLIARKLLDIGNPSAAYRVVREATPPNKENYRVEHEFTAGWIALRFLKDPATAAQHFARIGTGISNPISLARAGYWRGRAAEAMNKTQEARAYYEQAARYSTAYYGQLARARLGLPEIALASPPVPSAEKRAALAHNEVVRATEILYAINERELVIPIVADLAERGADPATLVALAELTAKYDDARCALLIGKGALGRGQPFDHYAFPTFGLPRYSSIGPEVEPAVVYSIARQESAFNPRDVSSANALGFMQVTPDAGRYVAKKFNVTYDQKRLLHDNVYNMQIGAAELGDDIAAYNGSYIMAFAGYNAGRGRVKEWVERYGDPRDPNVDPVDWVERIPFSETRNYVQRIIENVQVYRARFGGGTRLLIEADLRRGAGTSN
jgi:peptidoglycan lytic transglycosylase